MIVHILLLNLSKVIEYILSLSGYKVSSMFHNYIFEAQFKSKKNMVNSTYNI